VDGLKRKGLEEESGSTGVVLVATNNLVSLKG
jgi:hypothetical protein